MNLITEMLEKEKEEEKKALHFTLIDPDEQTPKEAAERSKLCQEYGTDAIMVGGSTIKERKIVDETVKEIKQRGRVKIPIILFPNSHEALSKYADYVFFMSLLNSKKHRYFAGEQVKGAPLVKDFNLKTISMAYLVISTSEEPTQVEKAVDLDVIRANNIEKAVNYALVANYLGMSCIYLEAGSGAEFPVPNEMIFEVKKAVDIPLIVGGGIKNGKIAKEKVDAGANVIVTGTIAEKDLSKIKEIIKAIKR
jgi:phosphoglycerol geranylgeranyltransferase